eukprot:2444484-Pyramimonas_sp.AAC.1
MARGTALVCKRGLKRSDMPRQRLRQFRREAGRALLGGRGAKCLALQLAAPREELTIEATEAPIVRWAREARHADY